MRRARLASAVRAAFAIPRKDDLKLRDYPTVASVIQFVYASRPDLKTTEDEGRRTKDE